MPEVSTSSLRVFWRIAVESPPGSSGRRRSSHPAPGALPRTQSASTLSVFWRVPSPEEQAPPPDDVSTTTTTTTTTRLMADGLRATASSALTSTRDHFDEARHGLDLAGGHICHARRAVQAALLHRQAVLFREEAPEMPLHTQEDTRCSEDQHGCRDVRRCGLRGLAGAHGSSMAASSDRTPTSLLPPHRQLGAAPTELATSPTCKAPCHGTTHVIAPTATAAPARLPVPRPPPRPWAKEDSTTGPTQEATDEDMPPWLSTAAAILPEVPYDHVTAARIVLGWLRDADGVAFLPVVAAGRSSSVPARRAELRGAMGGLREMARGRRTLLVAGPREEKGG